MFIISPPLSTNGTVSRYEQSVIRDSYVTTSLALAKARPLVIDASLQSLIGNRTRANLGKGIVSYKKYKPTSYYSYAMSFVSQGYVRRLYEYNPGGGNPHQFGAITRTLGYGYTGGSGTGMGSPDLLVRWNSNSGDLRAVGNRTIISNLINRANAEIMVKARRQKISLGESLVDIDKTIMMVANTSIRLYYASHHLERGDFKKAFQALGITHLRDRRGRVFERATTLESKWLALRYGWLPLVYDIHDGVQFVNQKLSDNKPQFVVSRQVKEWLPFFGHLWNLNNDPWVGINIGYTSQVSINLKYRLQVKDAVLTFLTSVGLENPLYVAWQVLPYSFVLDWLLPVSDWLSAMTAPLGLDFQDGYRSIHVAHRSDWTIKGYSNTGGAGVTEHGRLGTIESTLKFVELTREKITSFPTVQLYTRIPGLQPTRIADAISLIKERKHR
jgi:hypothetical protein